MWAPLKDHVLTPPPWPCCLCSPCWQAATPPPGGGAEPRGPQWACAQRKELVCCLPWAASAWKGHWMMSVCLSLADTSAGRGTQPVGNRAGPRGSLDEGQKRTGTSLSWGAGTQSFLGEGASPRDRLASSLPLAWHETDCRPALRVSEGRMTPAPLRPLALASLPCPRRPVAP